MSPLPGRLAAISVDVDSTRCYHLIHGLDPSSAGDQAYRLWLPRLLKLFEGLGIPASFFLVGGDLAASSSAAAARGLAEAGFELANHSLDHPYDLIRMSSEERARQVSAGHEAIAGATGVAPVGFRAPGYNVDGPLLDLVGSLGYLYDSSVLPCPPYYLAKAAAMALMALRGRRSRSIIGDPRALLAPRLPYLPRRGGHPYRRAGGGASSRLLEIPMLVLPLLRFPIIGTSILLMGLAWFRRIYPLIRATTPILNLELHAIDLADPQEDALAPELREVQPDLAVSYADRQRILRGVIETLAKDYRMVTLAGMAEELAGKES